MADAAQLKLQVGLDLAFFKQQLALLATTAVGYSIPIEFDRLGVQKEITKLGENIRRRNYKLEIKTNIQAETDKVVKFAQALKDLEGTEINVQITGTGELDAKEARKIRTALRRSILANGGKIKIPATILAAITKDDVTAFTRAAQAKLSEVALNVRADITSSADGLDTKEVRRIRVALHNAILSNGGKIKIPATVVPKIGGEEVTAFQKAVDSKFAGITIKVRAELEKGGIPGFAQGPHGSEALNEYLRTQGLSGGNVADVGRSERLRKQLEQQRVTQLRGLAKEEGLTGYSKLAKDPLIDKLVRELTSETAERILGNVQNMLRNAGGGGSGGAIGKMLDTFARGVFHMLGMDPAAMMAAQYQSKPGTMLTGAPSPALIGGAPGPFGLLPAAYRGIGPSRNAGALPPAYRGIGPSAEPAGLLPRTTSAGSRNDMMRMLSQGAGEEQPGVLAKTTKARIDEIVNKYLRIVEAQIKQVFDAPVALKKQLNRFSYLVQSLRDAETRTKQMQVPIPMAIGGTAFGSQKLLPSALGNETIKILRDAAHAFLNVMRQEMRAVVYQVGVQDLGNRIGKQAMLSGRTQGPLMLPAAGGTTPRSQMPLHSVSTSSNLNIPFIAPEIGESRKITRGVGAAGAGPGIAGRGMAPPSFQKGFGSPQALAIENAARQTLRLGLATDIAQRSLGKMNASQIPFVGGLRGVAGELGQATKQVLLYGAAYRALAAITSIPGQLLDAAKSQQQYTNGLKVATQETGTFAKELLFVDNVQRAFGLNLETTRTGFTRLYASMAPTGFDSGSIEKLFTGISAATAALQLTPDKAERVIYAFGQMASKGQIMSEELKGQLGDVLPGALAIFAKSAGMSVREFSKAMEDGEFVGNRFREVFAKVSDELMNRFGTGAQAAGKSLQGLLSTVGGDVTRTLESFAPLANAAAQATLLPLAGMLREVQMAAKIAMGEQDRVKKQLEDSRKDVSALKAGGASAKEIKAAEDNVAALAVQYEVLNEAAKDPAIAQQVKNIEAFVTEVQKAATFTMNLAGVIGNVLSPLITVLGGNFTSVIGNLALLVLGFNAAKLAVLLYMGAMSATAAVAGITRGGAIGATLLAGAFRLLGAQATAANVATGAFGITARGLLISTGVGALVVLIGSLAAAFLSVGDRAKEAADRTKQSIDSMVDASRTGNVSLITNELSINKADRQDVETLIAKIEKLQTRVTKRGGDSSVQETLVDLPPELRRDVNRGQKTKVESATNKDALLASLKERRQLLKEEDTSGRDSLIVAQKRAKLLGLNKPTPGAATTEEDDIKAQKAAAALASQQALADKLSADQTKTNIERQTALFENEKSMINLAYDLREARANSFQKETIRFQRELFNIEMKRQKAVLDANSAVTKAQGSVAGGPASTSGFIDKSVLRKWMESQGFGRTTGNFTNKGHATPNHMLNAMDMGIIGGSDADALRKTKAMEERLRRTGAFGNQLFGPTKDPMGHGAGKGGGNIHLHIPTPGGKVPMTPGLAAEMNYSGASSATSAGGKPSSHQKKVALADQQTQNALQNTKVKTTLAEAEALKEAEIAMVNYISSIAPVAEQDLQNQLLGKRIELMQSGVPEAFAETQMKIFEAEEKVRRAGEELDLTNQKQVEAYEKLKQSLPGYIALLEDAAVKQQQLGFTKTMKDLGDRVAMARALTPETEMRTRLQQQGYAGAQLETLFETEKTTAKAEELKTQMQGVASTIGDAFSTAFQGIINGSMSAQEALGNMFKSIGESFVKMAMDMIAKQLVMITLGFIMKVLGLLGGAGKVSDLNAPQSINNPLGDPGTFFELPKVGGTYAKGGAFSNGITKFATGGIVNGPTLFPFADGGAMQMGLMGEAGPEAIMPLQRGADGSLGVRAAMGGNGMGGSSSPILNMNFETSTINGVEYVSRDQLELAMAQTRRQASRDGANKGMAMTLDKIQQSPQTRRRIGM